MNSLPDPSSNNEKYNASADASAPFSANASADTESDNAADSNDGSVHVSGDERNGARAPKLPRPSLLLLAGVSLTTLALDLWSKDWALRTLEVQYAPGISVPKPISITPWLSMVLARNRGGAWGVFQNASDDVRKPFFLVISALAIALILYLYRRVHPKQHALKWGLPMVLGGAIGNLVDRVRHGWVVDFIDYKADWVRVLNEQLSRLIDNHHVSDHWPTFNVADIAICVGVGLMAVDMFTSRAIHRQRALAAKAGQNPQGSKSFEPPPSKQRCCEEGENEQIPDNDDAVNAVSDSAKLEMQADLTAQQETNGAMPEPDSTRQASELSSEQPQGAR